ncbi:tetratricopeptide repeat-containing sensor histidine kinase [Mangrovimonas yunxiaonensis]|nr:tetratricopeptide repeat-containing sensor histidine kinase [Mangrovimonas yunxiaonensis]
MDSITHYSNQSNNQQLPLELRIDYAKKAIRLAAKHASDSVLLKHRRQLSTLYLYKQDADTLMLINRENLTLAVKLKDSVAMAHVNNIIGWSHFSKQQIDSAYYYYYKASKLFSDLDLKKNYAETLLNMADIQFMEKDYLGAESNAVRSIRLYQTFPKSEANLDALWALYNLLGIISDELDQYDDAINYHKEALSYSDQIADNTLYTIYSNSNIALIYKKQEKYNQALNIYQTLSSNKQELLKEPSNYALILGDYAFVKHLSGKYPETEVKSMLRKAYRVSDSIQDFYSIMSVSLNAAQYYLDINQKDSALVFANRAYQLAEETNTNNVILKTLLLKSKIEPPQRATDYLSRYVAISDSLQHKERAIRNKFARIEFETDNLKEKNRQIARERMWFMVLSAGLIFTLVLLYIIVSQRAKNRQLQLVQQQQLANEEIYNLMLSQQDKIDEARILEKKRISEELHDGILGRLFGTRLSLDSLNMMVTPEAINNRNKYIEELKHIEQDIRKVSHDLNTDFVSGSSFFSIIKSLVETQCLAYGLDYQLTNDDDIDWDAVSNKTKIHYYRIVQESLQNIYKHANATRVEISFQRKRGTVCLKITDDGLGFDINKSKKGIGLKNMASRVSDVGGKLKIDSAINLGTTVTVRVPV